MDCGRIRDAFRTGDVPAGPDVAAHVKDCAQCTELFADGAKLGRALAVSPPTPSVGRDMWVDVEKRLGAEVGPRAFFRSRPTPQRLGLAAVAAVPAVAVGLRSYFSRDGAEHAGSPWAWVFAYAVLVLVCAALLFLPLGRPRPPRVARVGVGLFALTLPAAYVLVASVAESSAISPKSTSCLFFGLGLALPFAAMVWLLDRADRTSAAGALLVAAGAGLVGNVALTLHCAADDRSHLLFGHASVGVAVLMLFVLLSAFGLGTRHTRV
jgi:hypothetical protein